MVGIVENDSGLIIGYIEWNVLNLNGQFSNNPEYIHVSDIWVHKQYRKSGV